MSTPDDPMLRRLRTIPVETTAPGLDDLQQRARLHHRRHTRRRALTAGGVAVVLGVTGFAAPHLPWLSGPRTGAVAAPTCKATTDIEDESGGPAFWVRESDWDDHAALREALRLLPDRVPSLVGMHDDAKCPPALPTVVLYDRQGGRGITIWSGADDAADVVGRQPGARRTTIGGRPATISTTLGGNHLVAWSTPEGTARYARANGMSIDELRKTLGGLRLTAEGLDESTLPHGYRSAPVPRPSQDPVEITWMVEYDSRNAIGSELDYSARLEITTEPQAPLEDGLSYFPDHHFLTIGGRTAAWSPDSDGGARLFWDAGPARYQLVVPHGTTLKTALRMVDSLTPAADDDPRLTGAQHHGWW
jgi:hypothetical protein